jgi:uncharacterized membrane protein
MPGDIGGVPTHPLIVHIPVVLVPLALIAAIAYFVVRPWQRPLAWIAGLLAGGGALGAVLAASTGETLQGRLPGSAAIRHHAQLGESARLLAFIFFVVTAILVVFEEVRLRHRGLDIEPSGRWSAVVAHRATYPVIAALLAVSGVAAVAMLVDAGHAGAKVTWEHRVQP